MKAKIQQFCCPQNLWLLAILILGTAIRVWLCNTDAYLHEWDERYHALVAKNLMLHPLMPTLYETPILDYDYKEWAYSHIWLSKPPVPLWFIALSLKFWGITEWAVRFPSLLFSMGSVILTYKIADHLYGFKVALWAAFFHAIHGLTIEVSVGRFSSDHVETAFLFFMELGFWAMVKYYCRQPGVSTRKYAIMLGLATGLAFMCKWSAAFMLPIVWTGIALFSSKKTISRLIIDFSLIIAGVMLVASPWVFYILQHYPKEAEYMMRGIFSPARETIQGHGGTWYYYIDQTRIMFGETIYLPIIWLLWVTLKTLGKPLIENSKRLILVGWIWIPLVLLSMAATKRSNYLLPAAPAFFILSALFMRFIIQQKLQVKFSKIAIPLLWASFVLLPIRYSMERSKIFAERDTRPLWSTKLKTLGKDEAELMSKTVIFNEPHSYEAMFYTGCMAYSIIPSNDKIIQLKTDGWRVLENRNGVYLEH